MQIHSSSQDIWQGDDTVNAYLQKAKSFFDELLLQGDWALWRTLIYVGMVFILSPSLL